MTALDVTLTPAQWEHLDRHGWTLIAAPMEWMPDVGDGYTAPVPATVPCPECGGLKVAVVTEFPRVIDPCPRCVDEHGAPAGVVPRTVGIIRPEHGDPWHPEGIYRCNGCGRTFAEYNNGCPHDHEPPRKVVLVVPEQPGRVGTATVTAVPVVEARRIPNGSDTPADHDGPYVRVRPTGTVELIPYEGRHHLGGLGGRRGARMWGVPVNATALFATPPEPGDTVWRLDKENQ